MAKTSQTGKPEERNSDARADDNTVWCRLDGLEVNIYRSENDGRLVVDIIGPEDENDMTETTAPDIRIWLNEALIYKHGEVGDDLSPLYFPEKDCT